MLIKRRKGSRNWYTAFKVNGVSRSLGTSDERLAEEIAADLYRNVVKARKGGEVDAPRHLWNEAVMKWLEEKSGKGTIKEDISKFRFLDQYLGGKPLREISRQDLERIKRDLCATRQGSTANRYLALIRAVMMKCHREWEDMVNEKPVPWLSRVPKMPMSEENRIGIALTHEEVFKLSSLLPSPEKELVLFLAYTGVRLSNATGFQWEWLNDRVMQIPAKVTKGNAPITIVLGEIAYNALLAVKGNFGLRRKVWDKARKQMGYPTLRIHDLRHTFASWAAQNGATDAQLQQLGGWKSRTMVDRYAHMNVDSVRPVVEGIDRGAVREH